MIWDEEILPWFEILCLNLPKASVEPLFGAEMLTGYFPDMSLEPYSCTNEVCLMKCFSVDILYFLFVYGQFLEAFAKLWKATVYPAVRMEQLGSHWTDFDETSHLRFFSKICSDNSSFIQIWQEQRLHYMKTLSHVLQYLAEFFVEWEKFKIKVVEKIKTHILCSVMSFRKSCLLWDNVGKCGGAREAACHMVYARCMLVK